MDKQWVDTRRQQLMLETQSMRDKIAKAINASELFTAQDKQDLISLLDNHDGNLYRYFDTEAILKLYENHEGDKNFALDYFDIVGFIKKHRC